MKKTVVIYKSMYGSTKRYAEWIANALECDIYDESKLPVDCWEAYDVYIVGGGLYAGRINGVPLLHRHWEDLVNKCVVLFTVGLSDPGDMAQLAPLLQKSLTDEMRQKIKTFHFRGSIDYANLNFKHRTMMKMLRAMLTKKSEEQRSAEDQALLDTFGQYTDFSDENAILPLVDYVKGFE